MYLPPSFSLSRSEPTANVDASVTDALARYIVAGSVVGSILGVLLLLVTILVVTCIIVCLSKKKCCFSLGDAEGKQSVKYKRRSKSYNVGLESGHAPAVEEAVEAQKVRKSTATVNSKTDHTVIEIATNDDNHYIPLNKEEVELENMYTGINVATKEGEMVTEPQFYKNANEQQREVVKRESDVSHRSGGTKPDILLLKCDLEEPRLMYGQKTNNPNQLGHLDKLAQEEEDRSVSDEDEDGYVTYDPKNDAVHRTNKGKNDETLGGARNTQPYGEDIYENVSQDNLDSESGITTAEALNTQPYGGDIYENVSQDSLDCESPITTAEKHKRDYVNDLAGLVEKARQLQAEEEIANGDERESESEGMSDNGNNDYVNNLASLVEMAKKKEAEKTVADAEVDCESQLNPYVNNLAELVKTANQRENEQERHDSLYVNDLCGLISSSLKHP